MFIDSEGKIVKNFGELIGEKFPEEFVKENLEVWNGTAEFMGYDGPLFLEDIPIYFDGEIPEGLKVNDINRFFDKNIEKIVHSWMPNFDLGQAKKIERKLISEGRYNKSSIDYSLSKLGSMGYDHFGINEVRITYHASLNFKDIHGKGNNELQAICDACIKFSNNKSDYKKKWSRVIVNNTDKHF